MPFLHNKQKKILRLVENHKQHVDAIQQLLLFIIDSDTPNKAIL